VEAVAEAGELVQVSKQKMKPGYRGVNMCANCQRSIRKDRSNFCTFFGKRCALVGWHCPGIKKLKVGQLEIELK
jgi:hypothetical protein